MRSARFVDGHGHRSGNADPRGDLPERPFAEPHPTANFPAPTRASCAQGSAFNRNPSPPASFFPPFSFRSFPRSATKKAVARMIQIGPVAFSTVVIGLTFPCQFRYRKTLLICLIRFLAMNKSFFTVPILQAGIPGEGAVSIAGPPCFGMQRGTAFVCEVRRRCAAAYRSVRSRPGRHLAAGPGRSGTMDRDIAILPVGIGDHSAPLRRGVIGGPGPRANGSGKTDRVCRRRRKQPGAPAVDRPERPDDYLVAIYP